MNVLNITHSQDIDGMGCAILTQLAFPYCTIMPTKTFDINKNVQQIINNHRINQYDRIYVTDLCIKEPLLNLINNNPSFKSKIIILDHHKTEIEEGNNQYDFVNIIVEQNGRKESGTSLYYQYLVSHHYLNPSPLLDELVEWTRQYDVWEWKKHHNQAAQNLHILFETLGSKAYLDIIHHKIKTQDHLSFNEYEQHIIDKFHQTLKADITSFLKNIRIVPLTINERTYQIGYIKCPYKYRNDVNEEIIQQGNPHHLDAIGMIMTDIDTVSYRCIHDIDVSIIGKYFAGKGHRGAASHLQNNPHFQSIINQALPQASPKSKGLKKD